MTNAPEDDPVLKSATREALLIGAAWFAAAAYTTGYCYWNGYGRSAQDLRFVWGVPDWVFWGILVPWAACLAFSVWFALRFMRDDAVDAAASARQPGGEDRGDRGGADAG